jgi:hypothetical protein
VKQWVRVSFLAVAVAAGVLLAAASSSATRPRLVNAVGSWPLSRLGSPDLVFALKGRREQRSVPYLLPRGARQGPARWYLLHLHFRITFPKRTAPGFVFVSGLTNGRAAALFDFHVLKPTGGVSRIRWQTVDYIHGKSGGSTSGRSIEIRFTNYLQDRGVRPGKNLLTVQLERYTKTRAATLRVFRDSGISVTPLSPARLVLAVDRDVAKVHVGDRFAVGYTLRNTGRRPAEKVVLTPEFRPGTIELLGPRATRLKLAHGIASGKLHFRALRTGVFPLGIFVSSGSNKPGQLVEVRASRRRSSLQAIVGLLPRGIGGLLLLGGLAFVRPRRRPAG